jgi:hypothetical protein
MLSLEYSVWKNCVVSQHVFQGETSKIIFNIPRNPDYEKENKTKESISWWRAEITPVLPIAEQNFPRHFGETFEKFYLI